jgi:hypothetical protein
LEITRPIDILVRQINHNLYGLNSSLYLDSKTLIELYEIGAVSPNCDERLDLISLIRLSSNYINNSTEEDKYVVEYVLKILESQTKVKWVFNGEFGDIEKEIKYTL